ncbi:MAG: fimbrillin family protein, partial [Candidatus Phocaeicola merdigallinarum]|nr:fimbrillin family protein [Candidatus Phocaeicola merdigallinarum]
TGLSTENGNPAQIIPYDKGNDTYTALVAPQSVATGTAFITCAFNNGKTFAYRMQGAAEWKAGEEYTYTVSLAAAEDPGYTVSEDGNTYEVYNADGLLAWNKAVQGNLLLNCTLTDDINLTGKEWTPIGDYDNRYTGTFDGGNHTITGLTINQYGNYVGMIDFLDSGGTVQNLTLENVNITGGDIVGSVVGDNYGTVTACTASGNVSGTSRIGGVVGYNNGTVTACYHASGNVSGTSYIGGVVGRNTSGTLTACYHASGNVSGTSNVGGVVGYNISGTLTACYWSGLPENDNGGATKVDGTTVTWQNAVDAMNTALQSAGSEWRYELTGALPTLKKQ